MSRKFIGVAGKSQPYILKVTVSKNVARKPKPVPACSATSAVTHMALVPAICTDDRLLIVVELEYL